MKEIYGSDLKTNGIFMLKECAKEDSLALKPELGDDEGLPYFYVGGALLLNFVGENDKALLVLQKAEGKLIYMDSYYPYIMSRLYYYQNRPDAPIAYLRILNKWREETHNKIKVIESESQETSNSELLAHYRKSNRIATNLATYFLSEDIARGNEHAASFRAQLQQYVDDLTVAIDRMEASARKPYLDTYSYAVLVLEALKPSPDYGVVKTKVIPNLNSVVVDLEKLYEHEILSKDDASLWRIARAHLTAAKEFVGE